MLKAAAALALVLFLVGCSGGPCAGPLAGSWVGNAGSALTLSESCAFSYTGANGCRSTGTYADPLGSQGTVQVSITSATAGCLPAANYSCAYSGTSSSLAFNCGAGAETYHR